MTCSLLLSHAACLNQQLNRSGMKWSLRVQWPFTPSRTPRLTKISQDQMPSPLPQFILLLADCRHSAPKLARKYEENVLEPMPILFARACATALEKSVIRALCVLHVAANPSRTLLRSAWCDVVQGAGHWGDRLPSAAVNEHCCSCRGKETAAYASVRRVCMLAQGAEAIVFAVDVDTEVGQEGKCFGCCMDGGCCMGMGCCMGGA